MPTNQNSMLNFLTKLVFPLLDSSLVNYYSIIQNFPSNNGYFIQRIDTNKHNTQQNPSKFQCFQIKEKPQNIEKQNETLPCPNRSHTSGLVASVRLSTVLEVGVRPAGAVHADVPGGGDVGAPMGLRHDCHDGDPRGSPDRLGPELGEQGLAVRVGQRGDHLHELRGAREAVLAARGGLERIEVHVLALAREVHHGVHDLGDGPDSCLLFGQPVGFESAPTRSGLLSGELGGYRHGRHSSRGTEKGGKEKHEDTKLGSRR